jgi:HD superfamily phosphohydrolase
VSRTRIQRVQDCVHGLMEFQGMETSVVEVLRSPELQRLRRIRQLGLAHFVFPGAEHSRLVHSLGAAHLAIRFTRQLHEASKGFLIPFLSPDQTSIRDCALAALCHDLGHGPLSHVWERVVVGEDFKREEWMLSLGLTPDPLLEKMKWHELVGQALLAWPDGYLHKLLEQQEEGTSNRVRHLLLKHYYLPYLPGLLTGDIDVDRCDFILRDAHQTGVAYGRFDLAWLISTASIGVTKASELVVGFDLRKSPRVIEQFLIARRALYETVYHHKTVRSAEGMIGLLLKRFKYVVRESGWFLGDTPLFEPFRKITLGEALRPEDILGLDDYLLWNLIDQLAKQKTVDLTIADLAQRIMSRDLFKLVPVSSREVQEFIEQPDAYGRIHAELKQFVPGQADFYVNVDYPTFSMFSALLSERAYFVDLNKDDRSATQIQDHPEFRVHWREEGRSVRLFVPREAVAAIAKLISK